MSTLNPYKITFLVLKPVKGIATKADQKSTGFMRDISNNYLMMHAPSLASAKEKVESVKGKLSKDYEVFFITDKQLGMVQTHYVSGKPVYIKSFEDVATSQQLASKFLIK